VSGRTPLRLPDDPEPRATPVAHLASAIRSLDERRRALIAPPDAAATCGELLAIVVDAMAASRASLMVVNPRTGRLRIMAAFGLPADIVGRDVTHGKRRISDWVLRERRGVLLNGEVRDARFEGSAPEEVESALCLPLLAGEGAIGVLNLARTAQAERFGPVDLATAEHLARSLAASLQAVVERQVAEWGARGLAEAANVTKPVGLGLFRGIRYQIAIVHVPSLMSRGDRSERVAHGDGSQTVMVADVTGWGCAALVAGAFTQALFLATAEATRTPVEVVSRMNAELCRRLSEGRPVALWVARLSSSGALVSCNAGFPPPLCVPIEDDHVRYLDVGGPIAGVVEAAEYHEQTLRLLPGDAVLAVSDGILGARDAAGMALGSPCVEELVLDQRRQPLDRVAEAVCRAALDHSAARVPVDDLMVFALRYAPDA
jgi:hypothetical protein